MNGCVAVFLLTRTSPPSTLLALVIAATPSTKRTLKMSSPTSAIDVDALFKSPLLDTPVMGRPRRQAEDLGPGRQLFEPSPQPSPWDPSAYPVVPSPIARPGPVTRSVAAGYKNTGDSGFKETTLWDPTVATLAQVKIAIEEDNKENALDILENAILYAKSQQKNAIDNNHVIWMLEDMSQDNDDIDETVEGGADQTMFYEDV